MTGEKKARVRILVSDKIDFKTRAIRRDPEGHFIIVTGRIHQEDIHIVNIYALNIGAPKYIKKIDLCCCCEEEEAVFPPELGGISSPHCADIH